MIYMEQDETQYVEIKNNDLRLVRTEIIFTPLLVIAPLIVSGFLIYDWFCRGISQGSSMYDGELMLGIIILVSNIAFDVPFIKSLIKFKKKN